MAETKDRAEFFTIEKDNGDCWVSIPSVLQRIVSKQEHQDTQYLEVVIQGDGRVVCRTRGSIIFTLQDTMTKGFYPIGLLVCSESYDQIAPKMQAVACNDSTECFHFQKTKHSGACFNQTSNFIACLTGSF